MDSPINELATALAKAQGEMPAAKTSGYNPHFKNHFATLTDCFDVIKVPFANHGLSVTQPMVVIEGKSYLRTTLMHSSGQSLSSDAPIPTSQNVQGLGSSLSYLRRYCLKALVGIADDEGGDDGEEASRKGDNDKREAGRAVDKTGANRGAPAANNNGPGKPSVPGNVPGVRGPDPSETKSQLTEKQTNALLQAFNKKGLTRDSVALLLEQFDTTSVYGLSKEQGQALWETVEAMPNKAVPPPAPPKTKLVTEAQLKRLWALAGEHKWDKEHVHDWIGKEFGLESTKELDPQQYNLVCAEIMK